MRELCRRNGYPGIIKLPTMVHAIGATLMTHCRRRRLELPAPPAPFAGAETAVCHVFAVYDDASAGPSMAQIQ